MKNLVLYKMKSMQIAKILATVIIAIIYVKSDIKMYDSRINSLGDYLIYNLSDSITIDYIILMLIIFMGADIYSGVKNMHDNLLLIKAGGRYKWYQGICVYTFINAMQILMLYVSVVLIVARICGFNKLELCNCFNELMGQSTKLVLIKCMILMCLRVYTICLMIVCVNLVCKNEPMGCLVAFLISFFDRFFYEMFDILNPKGITFLEHTRIVYTEAVAPACENAVKILEINNLTKKFRNNEVLKNISLLSTGGETIGIIGKNASGKSILFKCITGLMNYEEGKIEILEKNIRDRENYLAKVGALIEYPAFIPEYTGYKNLCLLALFNENITKNEIKSLMRQMDLDPDSKKLFKNYSLGMKQKLGIVNAVMGNPPLIILDEPTSNMDTTGINQMYTLIEKIKENQNCTILLTSHSKEDIERLCDRIFLLDNGTLIQKH